MKVHGDNCEEDGISYDMTCVVCGETGTHHEYWHMPINTTVMDLSGYDICFDMAYQSTCACELAYREGGLEGQNYCDWLPLYEGINKSAEYCSVCGATRTQTTTVSQPDENCLVKETTKYDIADKNGKHIVTYYNDYYTTAHEYETVYTLKGDTCEDGVEITNTCINCGDSYTNYRTWCNVETVETVDLSGLGGCITRVERYSCPCGQNAGLWYYYGSSSCSTTLIDKGQGYEIRECRYCGIRQETRWTEEAVDSCHSKVKYTVTFSKDGKSKSVSYEQFAENHEIVYDLQLVEDATDCTGGYTIAEVCQKCDYRREYSGTRYTHNAYEVEKKRLDNGELCGEFYLVTVSCACGQESWTRTQWGKDNCDWSGYYSEELGCEVWECQDCGAIRYSERTETPVEGTCNVEIFEHIVYMKDGKELFSYDESYTSSRHAYVYDFNLYGESCTDGYDYTATCADCGATASGEGYYGHSWWATWRKIEHEDLCSTFYLQMGGCACGRDNGYGWNASCNFDWQYDEALDRYCNKCNECGLIMMQEEDYAATDDPCIWNSDREYSFYLNGEKLDSFTTSCAEEHHSWVYDFNLLGATCDDGYTYTQTCKFCGAYEDHSNDTHYGCSWWTMDQVMVYDSDDICGSIRYYSDGCACGKLSSNWTNYSCSFNHHWDEELERYVNECVDCGLVWMTDETRDEPDESCTVTVTRVNTFMLDGEVVGTSTNVTTEKSHDWHYEFNLQGETCEDGYTVTSVCNRCGQRNEGDHLYYDHDSWRTGEIEIHNGEGSCGKLVIYPYTCACGRNQGFDWSHDCSFSGYWEDNRTVVYECEYCDLNYTRTESYGVADENCDRTVTYDYVFKLGEEVLKTLSYTDTNKEHRWTREFTLLGQFCKDGYTMNSVCTRCGYREDSDHIYYGCESRTMGDYQVIYENENLCGPVYVESYRCACGLHSGYEIRTTCDSYEYWDDKEGWVYGCDDCDLKYQLDWNEFISEGENCVWQYKSHYTFHIGEETFEYSYNFQYPNHTWVYEYEMVEGGTSCEDGYYRIRTCADCGYADSRDGIYTGHDTNCVEYYDLADYGLCGGEIYLYSCACGENSYISWREDCDKEYTGNTDEATGAQERYCADCGTYTYYLSEGGFNRPACRTEYRFYYQAVHDDETQLLLDKNTGETRHTYVAKDYALNEGATDCEGGYTGRYECIYCGYGYTFSSNGHDTRPVEFIDLSDYDVCDSANYLEQRVCACGMYQDFSYNVCDNFSWYDNWTEDDENGNEHYYEVGKCDECGLEILWHQYVDLEDGSCDGTFYRYYTVTLGDSLNKTLVRSYPTTSHDWGEPVYTLYEDSVVCTDGIWSTRYCQREGCGATTRTGYGPAGHYFMNVTDSIDLAQYGSICGETLDYLECPCGAEYRWNFDNQNHCDLDQKSTDIEWLNEVIQRENLGEKVVDTAQYTSEGWVDSYSNAYIFTCAVTDPEACGLKVRMAEYWVKNGCEVTEYQTWQLGYDADTGECQYEFTVTTGDKHAYHDYEYSDADEYDENGRYTLDVDLDLCPDCGSYYKRQWFYEDGDHVKTERERVNTLDNGEMKRYYELYEYGEEQTYEHNGETGSFRYQTLSRSEYTYADGSEYWSQYAYTYNFQDACLRTYEYTNSDGGYDTGTDTCHNGYWDREDIEQPTCTQFGSWREWHTCYVCGEITDEYTYNYMPVAHYWYWNSEKETYVCSVCELENINGASGVVVMEDLTDDENWGSDTDYVIGYWNRENVQFTVELSVIFNDRDENHEDGNQFVLTGIEIADHTKENDGFVGKSFNKAAAIEAAEAKMEEQGYTGSFSIRINFVPANDDTDLDYAITFDPIEVGGDAEAEEETTEPVEEEAATEPDYSNMEEAPDDIFDF